MKSIFKLTILLTALLVFSSACKQATEKNDQEPQEDKISQTEIKEGVEEILFPLPEPMSMYEMLEDIGARYVLDVLNPSAAAEKYFAPNVKATNLGVYAADLSYATVYNDRNKMESYRNTLKSIVDDLGIDVNYQYLISKEAKQKTENQDSLIQLTTEVFYETYDFLYSESDPAMAALMVNGMYIEGLYIATHISEDTYNNVEMVKIIFSQAKPLAQLIELNGKFSDNQYLKTLQDALLKLKALYDEAGDSLTQEQFEAMKATIAAIRESIVS